MAKNRQKSAKFIRKIDFLYNNFPKKAISLRKCTNFFFRLRRKKSQLFFSRLRRETVLSTPWGGCYINFATMPRLQRPLYLSLGGCDGAGEGSGYDGCDRGGAGGAGPSFAYVLGFSFKRNLF